MRQFIANYAVTLWNLWLWLAGGILGLNEIAEKFAGRSWEWPRRHRLTAVLTVLTLAQIGAYKTLTDQTAATIASHELTVTKASSATTAALLESHELRERLEERETRIGQLQTALLRTPVPVDVRLRGLTGPPPVYSLSSDTSNLTWPGFTTWTSAESAIQVSLPWDDMADFDAYAELRIIPGHAEAWGQARIWDLTSETVAIETPETAATSDRRPTPYRLLLPRQQGTHDYILQLRHEAKENAGVNALGAIALVRRR